MVATGAILSHTSTSEGIYHMRKLVSRFVKNDEGAALVEYGILVGLIAVVCVVAVGTLGTTINTVFTTINADLAGV
jgi:pilus assembly protein Flp/PilA